MTAPLISEDKVLREALRTLAAYEHRLEHLRKRYHSDPEYRARKLAVAAQWHAEHREQRRAYNREYMRRWRAK